MLLRLQSFQVINFRSIINSDEIQINECTCLVGTNESGKTNLLAALHKLNPADSASIDPLTDYPRKQYALYETQSDRGPFIRATFTTDALGKEQLSQLVGFSFPVELLATVEVARYYSGSYDVNFPASFLEQYPNKYIHVLLAAFWEKYLTSDSTAKDREENSQDLREFIDRLTALLPEAGSLGKQDVYNLIAQIDEFITVRYSRRQPSRLFVDEQLKTPLEHVARLLANKRIVLSEEQQRQFLQLLPRFVYYGEYSSLDAEIYLPHVVQNSTRQDLSIREQAKVRTLKILFDFVRLKPEEILELGSEVSQTKVVTRDLYGRVDNTVVETAPENTVEQERANKKRREVILQTASAQLTEAFRNWWHQGNYRFRFQADGNHFRIWVSDDKRTEEIELDGRSKGLQWFLSFFLTFQAEQANGHTNCILLLDEPGLSLHPIAQQDLLTFLHSLSRTNQLIYTTHSPFLIGNQSLANLKMLYVGDAGNSVVADAQWGGNSEADASFYPIKAALAMNMAKQMLVGRSPVLVQGGWTQVYLQLIQSYLLRTEVYPSRYNFVFVPMASLADITSLVRLLPRPTGLLPSVLVDGAVVDHAQALQCSLYKDEPARVITLNESQTIEDLLPAHEVARQFSRLYRGLKTDDFDYLLLPDQPIVEQIQSFAEANVYTLASEWRLLLAQRIAATFDKIIPRLQPETIRAWVDLFEKLA